MSALTLSAPQSRTRAPYRVRPTALPTQHSAQPRQAVRPVTVRRPTRAAATLSPGRSAAAASPGRSAAAASPGRSATASSPARLTRRGRLVMVAALTLLLFVGLGGLSRVVATATSQGSSGPVTKTWVVQPGESLWDVAVAVDPGTDPRETIATIVDLNDLPQSAVTVGQSIQVPIR